MDDIKKKMEIVRSKEEDYLKIDPGEFEEGACKVFDAEDLIVENKLLIDKVDQFLGRETTVETQEKDNDEMD